MRLRLRWVRYYRVAQDMCSSLGGEQSKGSCSRHIISCPAIRALRVVVASSDDRVFYQTLYCVHLRGVVVVVRT